MCVFESPLHKQLSSLELQFEMPGAHWVNEKGILVGKGVTWWAGWRVGGKGRRALRPGDPRSRRIHDHCMDGKALLWGPRGQNAGWEKQQPGLPGPSM